MLRGQENEQGGGAPEDILEPPGHGAGAPVPLKYTYLRTRDHQVSLNS